MNEPTIAIETAVSDLQKLRRKILAKKDKQVRGQEERLLAGAVANDWFNRHSAKIRVRNLDLSKIDEDYKKILRGASATPARPAFRKLIDSLKNQLIEVKIKNAAAFATSPNSEPAPDFSKLIKDVRMQKILLRRWVECQSCVDVNAVLASIVMMGGFLEALLLAKINAAGGLSSVSKYSNCPKDKKGRIKNLKDWTLWDMIEVCHEATWVSIAAKSVGHVLRDYRNWIHPLKEFTSGTDLSSADAEMLWNVSKEILKQLVK